MRTHLHDPVATRLSSIPLLDASSLPSNDDWALLESLNAHDAADFEPDFDRYGRVRLSASYDE